MALDSMQEIFEKMQEGQKPFWKVVQDTDVEERQVTPEASFEKMRMTWKAMLETVDTYRGDLRSLSGLVGGDGQRMAEFAASGKALAGDYLSQVITLALCTAESKLHYTVPVSGKDDTGSLCGDQGLMINDIQDRCLYELCFHNRGNDLNERFFWKDYRSFGNSINISRKVEASEIVQEIFAEDPQTPEIIHILISEIQIFYIFNYLIQSGADRISASAWILAEEYVKDDGFILPLFVVSLHHSKFIEVSKQGKVVSVHCSF